MIDHQRKKLHTPFKSKNKKIVSFYSVGPYLHTAPPDHLSGICIEGEGLVKEILHKGRHK
jgi:hypothetical protein